MSRKEYQEVAGILKSYWEKREKEAPDNEKQDFVELLDEFCRRFKKDNRNFDRVRFLEAVGF